ncbi:hypothetical protein G6O69_17485 [Pseudenhygromyxa sp. WMMC2535]|uniref:hypothetical protein n=1 Tax=Pseudenhygromyxa sp. WMMC2535 TaxID=2712867 RepID=UPI00155634E6|nr:hypothetical protein [Pseudenhygromyxa sp. WMMC2535]NVB39639.1 hypothetical protein [Pseudenhygromyxa sp. WMMC2535]
MTHFTSLSVFQGAVRTALASLAFEVRYGAVESRRWDSPTLYLADDGCGNRGAIQFAGHDCIGVCFIKELPTIDIVSKLTNIPVSLRSEVESLADLQFFVSSQHSSRITSVFWSIEGKIDDSNPSKEDMVKTGDELFSFEFLSPALWKSRAAEGYELPQCTLDAIFDISTSTNKPGSLVRLSAENLEFIFPREFGDRKSALDNLLGGGAFSFEST